MTDNNDDDDGDDDDDDKPIPRMLRADAALKNTVLRGCAAARMAVQPKKHIRL